MSTLLLALALAACAAPGPRVSDEITIRFSIVAHAARNPGEQP